MPDRKNLFWIIFGFFCVTFIVYSASLGNRFVAWDDNYVIDFNPVVHGFTWDHLQKAFTTFVDPELYTPLTFVSYMFDYTIGGLKPLIFHFDNLLLHTLNALCVAWLLYLLSRKSWIGIVGGLIFAVHPLNAEAVAWASARKDTLSTLFFLSSIIAYIIYRRHGEPAESTTSYWLSILLFLLGLLSKVMVLTLPIVLLLLDIRERRKWNLRMWIEKIPYFALSILFGLIALFGKKQVVAESNLLQKILMAAKSTTFYIEKFFWPTKLSVIYPYTKKPITFSSPDFFFPCDRRCCIDWNWHRDVSKKCAT